MRLLSLLLRRQLRWGFVDGQRFDDGGAVCAGRLRKLDSERWKGERFASSIVRHVVVVVVVVVD